MKPKLTADKKVTATPLPGYRPNVVAVIINAAGQTLTARRSDINGNSWQYPQGGIEIGEVPLSACLRELYEETGINPVHLNFIEVVPYWIRYNIPPDLLYNSNWSNIGQIQAWFLLRLAPGYQPDLSACLHRAPHQVFNRLAWQSPLNTLRDIVAFKAAAYRNALAYFADGAMRTSPLWERISDQKH